MTGDELTPERLDAILDGDAATTDDERNMLALAAQLRADVPTPSDELRTRVASLGEPARQGAQARTPRRRGWTVAAPALSAALVAIVGTVVFMQSSKPHSQSTAIEQSSDPRGATPTSTLGSQERDKQDKQHSATPSGGGTPSPSGSESSGGGRQGATTTPPTVGPQSSSETSAAAPPTRDDAPSAAAPETTKAPVTAPVRYRWTLPAGELAAAVADIRDVAGVAQAPVTGSRDGDAQLISVGLPQDVRTDLIQQIDAVLRAHQGTPAGGPMTGLISESDTLELVLVAKSP